MSDCGAALVITERLSLTQQQRSIIAGNAASSRLSPTVSWRLGSLDMRHSERLSPSAWRNLAHLSLAVCPPSLTGFTEPDDPLGRKSLSHKRGSGLVKRHNLLVHVVHSIETEAGRASRLEVTGLYADSEKRVDTHSIILNTSEPESTDARAIDPHTASRVDSGLSVEACIAQAEREKDSKYNSADDRASDGSSLTPLVFTPGGRIGPRAERFLRRLAAERASLFRPPGDAPSLQAEAAIYRSYRRRLANALARGLALQISIYGLERRVGPPTAASLRAAYPALATPAPNSIPGQHPSTARPPRHRPFFRKRNARRPGV